MAATYNLGAVSTTPLYQVRLIIGDTVMASPQFDDAEILYFLSQRANSYGAAAECCRALSTQYARSVDQSAGAQKINYSQMAQAYAKRAQEFAAKAAMMGSGTPYAGGISEADKTQGNGDEDNVQPSFAIGMFDSDLPVAQLSVVDGAPSSDDVR